MTEVFRLATSREGRPAALLREIKAGGVLSRGAEVNHSTIDTEARTVELAFSSETDTVERWFGIEILGHGPGEMDLGRLISGAPVLWNHDRGDQRGVVISARVDADRVGRAVVRFSRSAEGEQLFQDIVDGIVTKVSVGYDVQGLQLVEERNGVDVYRITAWQPNEISLVSIPADDTVGVGRAATPIQSATRAAASISHNLPRNSEPMLSFQSAFDAARNAPGDHVVFNDDHTVRGILPRRPAAVSHMDIRTLQLSTALGGEGRVSILPAGTKAGQVLSFMDAVINASLFVQAGGQILMPPSQVAVPLDGVGIGWQQVTTDLVHVGASTFSHLIDGDDTEYSVPPISRVWVDHETMPNYAAAHKLTNAEQKEFKAGQLADTAGLAMAFGVARLIDKIAFRKILRPLSHGAMTEAEYLERPLVEGFTIARAASAGLSHGSLRAIVGTNGAGAQIDAAGVLRVNGVEAALSDTVAESIVGDFRRCAVAIGSHLTLTVERKARNRDLSMVGMISAQAFTPVPSSFFRGV